jgi:hydroxyacylglutathione hydrolase
MTKESLIIDPGLDKEEVQQKINSLEIIPIAILATHGHFDHIGSVAELKERYKIPFFLHKADLKISKSANFFAKMAKINIKINIAEPDFLITDEKVLTIGSMNVNFFHLPGHSSGSSAFQIDNNLFSGDIIYKNGLGFNHFPGEDLNELKKSVKTMFSTFSDETMIYPGHGIFASLGEIKKENKELIEFVNSNS